MKMFDDHPYDLIEHPGELTVKQQSLDILMTLRMQPLTTTEVMEHCNVTEQRACEIAREANRVISAIEECLIEKY